MKDDIKRTIIYLHGFNSSPEASNKVTDLKNAFPDIPVIAPRLPYDPLQSIIKIMNIIKKKEDFHIVGTSLGGFYVMMLHHLMDFHDDLHYYAINPVLRPDESFKKRIGQEFENYGDGEKFCVTQEYVDNLSFLTDILYNSGKPKYCIVEFFLGMRDEVVDPEATKAYLYSLGLPVRINSEDQDHRFQDLTSVIERIRENFVFC
jgi:predicted esterase YcpF (UPF0227 family)